MSTARSRAVTFIASQEVFGFLSSLESGIKSKVINRAIRQYMDSVDPDDVLGESAASSEDRQAPNVYQSQRSELAEFAAWLEAREEEKERRYQITDNENTRISLVKLLKIFAKRNTSRAGKLLAEMEED